MWNGAPALMEPPRGEESGWAAEPNASHKRGMRQAAARANAALRAQSPSPSESAKGPRPKKKRPPPLLPFSLTPGPHCPRPGSSYDAARWHEVSKWRKETSLEEFTKGLEDLELFPFEVLPYYTLPGSITINSEVAVKTARDCRAVSGTFYFCR